MSSRSLLHHRPFIIIRLVAVCALLLIAALATTKASAHRKGSKRQTLSFEDRVAAQRAIEAVYHRHRLWPTDNPQPKPALDEVLPEAALRAKVEDYLRMSRALEVFAGNPLTPEQLQQELERMARQTRSPEVLGELWAALSHDPLLAAECLARPAVAERELRRWYEQRDEGRGMRDEPNMSSPHPSSLIPHPFDQWWSGVRGALGVEVDAPGWAYRLPEIATVAAPCGSDSWTGTNATGAPSERFNHTAVWTGSEMIVWGGQDFTNPFNTGGRYNPATDTWTATSTTDAPTSRSSHTAIWTGSEMIVWGGAVRTFLNDVPLDTGGRYNPTTNTWVPTGATGVPTAVSVCVFTKNRF